MSPESAPSDRSSHVGAWLATLFLIVAFVFGLLIFPPYFAPVEGAPRPADMVLFFGRFHPILVHLPVGILVFLMVLEVLCFRRSGEAKHGASAFLALWFGSAGAVFAVLAGIMLSRGGGYGGGMFTLHQSLGIIGTAGILLGLVLRLIGMTTENRGLIDGYRAVLLLSFSIMGIGAHFGANMVHGRKYLTQYAPAGIGEKLLAAEDWMIALVDRDKKKSTPSEPSEPAESSPPEETPPAGTTDTAPMPPASTPQPAPAPAAEGPTVFAGLILPILAEKCNNCHNEDKSKGDLRMDTYALLMQGGDSGDNVVPGKPDESLLITRILLPEDDDEHMPPEGKDQITPAELALLQWWIAEGASDTLTVAAASPPKETAELVKTLLDSASR
jgi:uncharacterized membrane protein